jgi:hypothetical protein
MELFFGRKQKVGDPLFVGSVRGMSFSIRRYIQGGRNSFLPLISGRLLSIETGTRVKVTMFIHPLSATFTAFWLAGVGWSALKGHSLIPAGMFIFGIALMFGCFVPEVIKAKRLLVAALTPSTQPYTSATPFA